LKKVLISAGEASGDFYGAELAKQIKKLDKKTIVIGFGGPKMRAAGIDMRLDPVRHAAMGYWEVLKTLPFHLSLFFSAKNIIKKEKPDVLVVIDSPSFHMPLIKDAKNLGVKKVIYYSTPQVWIWKYERIYEIKKHADLCIVVLPFEKKIFRKEGIRAEYFGHPVSPFLQASGGIKKSRETVGIFPGSRVNEIKYFFEDVLKTCELIKTARKNTEFKVFKADTIPPGLIEKYAQKHPGLGLKIIQGWDIKSRVGLSAAIAKSGTVTLELALLGVPEAVVYRLSGITYFIMSRMAGTKFVSLPNIILKKEAIKEFIQGNLVPEKIAAETLKILADRRYAAAIRGDFARLRKMHGPAKDAVKNAARAVLKEADA
jgi:lipid-A-disaccharide synthase